MNSIIVALLLIVSATLSAAQGWGGFNGGMGGFNGGMGGFNGGMGGFNGGMGGFNGGGFNRGFNGGMPPRPGWGGSQGGWNAGGANVGDGNILNANNFQASGCGWDFTQSRCRDLSLLPPGCQGGCKNFGSTIFSDCRCVPANFFGKK